jgi:Tfp pilus tip-associated adhesin PilY1
MGGQVVVANTGRLLYDKVSSTNLGDAGSTQTQTVYGIWDRTGFDQLSTTLVPAFSLTPDDRNKLQAQGITGISSLSTTTSTFYDLSTNSVSWGASTGGEGWRLDLKVPDTSSSTTTYSYPKAIYPPQKLGNGVLVSAVKPGAIEESCSGTQAIGYGFFIKALTGARSTRASIDANGNGQFDDSEIAVGGFSTPGGGPGRVLTGSIASSDGSTTKNDCLTGSDQLADSAKGLRACDDPSKRIKDRIWRQLLNPPKP